MHRGNLFLSQFSGLKLESITSSSISMQWTSARLPCVLVFVPVIKVTCSIMFEGKVTADT